MADTEEMRKGFFDGKASDWVIRIPDKTGKNLTLSKNPVTMNPIGGGKPIHRDKIRLVWLRQSDYPDKIMTIEEISGGTPEKRELRFGYYIIGKKGRKKGRWTWGQFALIAPKEPNHDIQNLIQLAREKGLL